MAVILELHAVLSNTTIYFFLLLGVWGLIRALRNKGVDGSYMGAMVIGELLFIVQAIMGLLLLFNGNRPGESLHWLYGVFAIVFLPGLFTYIKGDDSNRGQWIYALGTLFLFGIALRSVTTGV